MVTWAFDLERLGVEIWQRLARGARISRDPFHFPSIATTSPRGPEVRTVVLRAADVEARTLTFHTDRRSPKVSQLLADPRVTWHFYDRPGHVQMRVRSSARIHAGDDLTREVWSALPERTRQAYRDPRPPGSVLTEVEQDEHASDDSSHFAVVVTEVSEVDWLHLGPAGHRRAVLRFRGESRNLEWRVP